MNRKLLILLTMANGVCIQNSLQAEECYDSQRPAIQMTEPGLSDQQRALLYLSCGYSNLVSQKYSDAFEDYQRARDILQNSDNPGLQFLVSFGMTVTCDNLHLTSATRECLAGIKELLDAGDESEDDMFGMSQNEYEVAKHLAQLALLAPSPVVREALESVVSEVFAPSCTSQTSLSKTRPSFLSPKTAIAAMPCRSFWKTLKKIKNSIVDAWNELFKIYKDIKEIREDFKEKEEKTKTIV